jgi:hypothetical protein
MYSLSSWTFLKPDGVTGRPEWRIAGQYSHLEIMIISRRISMFWKVAEGI